MTPPNVIFLVVDALCYDSLNRKIGDRWVMPHLRELAQNNVSWDNVFSLAPYTEAALVSLLGGERTMENGGYFFGNAGCPRPLPKRFSDAGYRTLLGYSPYVYSKAYLQGVTDIVHTRRYSILPLFMYRLDEYGRRLRNGSLTETQMIASAVLINEALETWHDQVLHIIKGDECAELIADWGQLDTMREIEARIAWHAERFLNDWRTYTERVLREGRHGELPVLSEVYNRRPPLPLEQELKIEYQPLFEERQEAFSHAVKHGKLDKGYLFSTLFNDKGGWRDFIGLLQRNYQHRNGRSLAEYLGAIDEASKVEASAPLQLGYLGEWASARKREEHSFFAYIQFQDFHLPSVFHTVDTCDKSMVSSELEEALELLSGLDERYSGNVVADLSAHYIDAKLKSFLDYYESQLAEDCMLVITADHGYPLYDDPPRPFVYNQTYSEAFHVPFVVRAPGETKLPSVVGPVVDNLTLVDALVAGILDDSSREIGGEYIISEYGGPGCPDMSEKEVWYTYIDERYRISAECKLDEKLGMRHVKTVIDLKSDPEETHNIVRRAANVKGVRAGVAALSLRHERLHRKASAVPFWNEVMSPGLVRSDICRIRCCEEPR